MKWPWSREPETISKSDLLTLIPYSKTDPLIFDRSYQLPTDDEVLSVLGTDFSPFEDEVNDCDDYAFRAKGLVAGKGWPFAVAWINSNHMIVGWLNNNKIWVWLEPQGRKPFAGEITSIDNIII